MKRKRAFAARLLAGAACVLVAPAGLRATTLVSSFNPGLGTIEAIAFDPVAGTLFLFPIGTAQIHEFTTAGVEVLPAIPAEAGAFNDTDLDFTTSALSIAGTSVPAGSLIAFNGDVGKVQALDESTGGLIAEVSAAINFQGGFVTPTTGKLFGIDWYYGTIDEIDSSDGHVVSSFPISPPDSPAFSIYYGDADDCVAQDVILVAGSTSTAIRFLRFDGSWLDDLDLSTLGINAGGIAGLALDDTTGNLWIAGISGVVTEVSGVCDALMFRDGFETGDTTRWSSTSS